jgi:predicted S18 family serine protease
MTNLNRIIMLVLVLGLAVFASEARAQCSTNTYHQVALAWTYTPSADANAATATGFQVQRATVSGGPYTTIGTTANATVLTFVDAQVTGNDLCEGSTYYYVVETIGNGDVVSVPSNEAAATIPFVHPAGPGSLSGPSIASGGYPVTAVKL